MPKKYVILKFRNQSMCPQLGHATLHHDWSAHDLVPRNGYSNRFHKRTKPKKFTLKSCIFFFIKKGAFSFRSFFSTQKLFVYIKKYFTEKRYLKYFF